MAQLTQQVLVNVPLRTQSVGFRARSARIDNNTTQYAFVAAAGAFVPPGVTGYPLSLDPGWSELEVTWPGPPPGQFVPPVQSAQETLLVTWSDDPNATGSGGGQATYTPGTPQVVLDTIVNQDQSVHRVRVPTGTQALMVVNATPFPRFSISVTGVQSGIAYYSGALLGMPGNSYDVFLIVSAVDSQVDWTVSMNSRNEPYYLVAIFNLATVDVQGPAGGPVVVTGTTIQGAPDVNNVLGGVNYNAGGTIITIPAGRTWSGSLWGTVAAAAGWAFVAVLGDINCRPNGTLLQVDAAANTTGNNSIEMYVASPGGNGTLTFQVAGAPSNAICGAMGILL